MSAEMDPAKMKVVDLRQELAARGLDTKGNKPALVKRLKDALELELKRGLPDTSIADTSTEDADTSQRDDDGDHGGDEENSERMETEDSAAKGSVPEQNGDGNQGDVNDKDADDKDKPDSSEKTKDGKDKAEKTGDDKKDGEGEQKGEKRRRSSTTPERSQRRRSKSPVKEDEPPLDENKVQLSWYDSDLQLQVDKESFLSAKPLHDGAFGYAWAGARATHGVSSGKVYYEVKLTDQLKWEDFSKIYENRSRDRYRYDARKNKNEGKKKEQAKKGEEKKGNGKKEDEKKETKEATENGEVKPESTEEKLADEAEKTSEESAEKSTEKDEKQVPESKEGETKPVEEGKPAEESAMETDEAKTEEKAENDAEKTDAEKAEKVKPKEEKKPIVPHLFRAGWSVITAPLQLGEAEFSYGYESTGKFVTNKEFKEFGKPFGVNDVVGVFAEINEDTVKFSFTVNDGEPEEIEEISRADLPEEFALFPHVLSKNYAFEINLGSKDPWFPVPESLSDYVFIDQAEEKVAGPVRPVNRSDCEVLLMCGLPASGKTHWVRQRIEENLDKRYNVIGNAHILEKMTVEGCPLRKHYKGRWNVLLDKTQKCLNELLQIAALRRRNYIIDQTNVFPSAQRRKLRPFEGFKRCAVVVVVGDEEQAKRQSLQEAQDGKDMPDSAVLELKANMALPEKNNWIDEVLFPELQEEEAKAQVKKYNTQGKEAGYGQGFQKKPRDDRRKFYNAKRLNDRGPRDRFSNRFDRGRNWYSGRSGGARGAGWDRDRRDSRPYSGGGGSREWRSSSRGGNRPGDRVSRDRSGGGSYGRNRSQNSGGRPAPWQSSGGGGSWGQSQGGWSQPWSQSGSWGGQGQGGNWGSQGSQGSWKYGSGGGGGSGGQGYGGNWNYYGQYAQNWSQSRKKP